MTKIEDFQDRISRLTPFYADKSRRGMQHFLSRRQEVQTLLDEINAERARVEGLVKAGELTSLALVNLQKPWETVSKWLNDMANGYRNSLLNSCQDYQLLEQRKLLQRRRNEVNIRIRNLTGEISETGRQLDLARKQLDELGGDGTVRKIVDALSKAQVDSELKRASGLVRSLESDAALAARQIAEAHAQRREVDGQYQAVIDAMIAA